MRKFISLTLLLVVVGCSRPTQESLVEAGCSLTVLPEPQLVVIDRNTVSERYPGATKYEVCSESEVEIVESGCMEFTLISTGTITITSDIGSTTHTGLVTAEVCK